MNAARNTLPGPAEANPLLDFSTLPHFDAVRPEHIGPAVDALLAQAEAALAQVTAPGFAADWQSIAQTLDVSTERLERAWATVSHLNAVADHPAQRQAYTAALPKVTAFWTRLGSHERLHALYQAIAPATLNAEQRQAHANALRDFKLGGAQLQGAAKHRFAAIAQRLAELSQQFSNHLLDATDAWAYYATDPELDGVPPDVVQAARAAAAAEGKPGHKLTLKMPCYLPVMQFGNHRALRQRLYRAHVTRASDQAEAAFSQYDNSALMREILALRHEQAALLGYASFAELSLEPKMADSPAQVMHFLRDLAHKARAYAEKDLAELRDFAARDLNLPELQAWDLAWASEKLKQARYAFSPQQVKAYFTAPKVLAGLFAIVERLFEVRIVPDDGAQARQVWHDSVRLYRLERPGADGSVQLIGQFYLDPGARSGKRGGAWMDEVRARWLRPDTGALQTPVAQLVCNFAQGVDGKPPLLTHDDVTTLFHEAGHGLHHLLTQVAERDVAGISGVEWDAVELPSQFMENLCWQWSVLQDMTAHVDTGAPLPRELFDKMLAAKNFQSGLQTLRQIELALLDMRLHAQYAQHQGDVQRVLREVRDEAAVLPAPAFNRMAHGFSHIFAGGYAAGYYSYKWAEVLAADAWAAFEETQEPDGSPNVQTARRWRREILETGGSRPALESFKAFRGREPQPEALLRQQGMAG